MMRKALLLGLFLTVLLSGCNEAKRSAFVDGEVTPHWLSLHKKAWDEESNASLVAMIPSRFFSTSGLLRNRVDDRMSPDFLSSTLLVLTSLTLASNLTALDKSHSFTLPRVLTEVSLVVSGHQNWSLFVGPSLKNDGWFSLEIETESGQKYDAWRNGEPFTQTKPESVSATYPDDRWRKWMMTLAASETPDRVRNYFVQWLLEEWTRTHGDDPPTKVKFWHVLEITLPGNQVVPAEWHLIGEAER